MAQLPVGTVTFVCAEIEESTELLKRLGDGYADVPVDDLAEPMASLGDEIDARVQEALAKRGVPPAER